MTSNDRATSFLRLIRRAQRGRLKIYLGYVAGVGKTYQMLLEGHRLKEEGIDVVVGLVETHGREDTARLIDGLEVVPAQRINYRGLTLDEMDVDAVLKRRPQVALIDELAHTNVPGSRNTKRYQDVEEILSSGIHVITTLNIQHLESLCDTVEKEIGVKIRERIPDTIVAAADQVVNVDLTTEDLRERLQEGKIYPPDRIGTALANFFVDKNLETLRELTLREVAAQIDLRRREQSEEEILATPDQVMVCLSSRGPNSEKLLRYGSRLAGRLNRNWYALYVQTPSEEPSVIEAETQRLLSSTLTLAKELGAIVFTYQGTDVPETILRFAREYRVGHIVIGTPAPIPRWKRLLGHQNVVERLVEAGSGITLVVIDTRVTGRDRYPTPVTVPKMAGSDTVSEMRLSTFLSPRRIVVWNQPVSKQVVLGTLAEMSAADIGPERETEILERILARENQSSTFLNEGVAFPHARIEGITVPLVALGISRQGISDVQTEKPTELTFFILTPVHNPEIEVRILGLVSRLAKDAQWCKGALTARDAKGVYALLRESEATVFKNQSSR
ncbi:MAG: PTS sugar transporter subunit IIA [Thermodesulfobacteriota bacterium]